ncbi:MAG TPA: hypothetical protein VE076_13385, partial [Nitrososphaeraceae archaeon]|nr:hypothetical protein [Nitrososphaeraceae archaeon]
VVVILEQFESRVPLVVNNKEVSNPIPDELPVTITAIFLFLLLYSFTTISHHRQAKHRVNSCVFQSY